MYCVPHILDRPHKPHPTKKAEDPARASVIECTLVQNTAYISTSQVPFFTHIDIATD